MSEFILRIRKDTKLDEHQTAWITKHLLGKPRCIRNHTHDITYHLPNDVIFTIEGDDIIIKRPLPDEHPQGELPSTGS